ncbi:MAG: FHA domain-containing protein [Planctomycetota bacterium]|jgi:hypothetical protein
MARLFVLSGASIGATHEIDGTSVVGRGADADVVIPEPSVSRKHARLVPEMEAGVWKVVDLGSSNGVHVGGRRVKEARIRDGETFVLGEVEVRLRDEGADDEGGLELEFEDDPAPAPAPARRPAPPAAPRAAPRAAEPPSAKAAPPAAAPTGADEEQLREARARAAEARARAADDRAARRAAAAGGASQARGAVASGGGQVLQYSQHRRGDDLNQLPGWKRALLAVVAVAFAAAVAYGAFELTRTARSQAADLAE